MATTKIVTDKSGNQWEWVYDDNGKFKYMSKIYSAPTPIAVAAEKIDKFSEVAKWIGENWQIALIGTVCVLILTR